MDEIGRLILVIQKHLDKRLLHKNFIFNPANPTYGFCYVASECFYHLYGKEHGYFPVWGKDENSITHWWLENSDRQIADPTGAQYLSIGKLPPYDRGTKGAFLTKQPSKRCQILIDTIKGSEGWESPIEINNA